MGLFGRLGRAAGGLLQSKGVRKESGGEAVEIVNNKVVRRKVSAPGARKAVTTSKTVDTGNEIRSGGQAIPGGFGGSAFNTLTGKTAKYTAAASIPIAAIGGAAYGGLKLSDYRQDIAAQTPMMRGYEKNLDLAEREIDILAKSREMQDVDDLSIPASGAFTGGSEAPFPIFQATAGDVEKNEERADKQSMLTKGLVLAGIGVAGIAAYGYARKK